MKRAVCVLACIIAVPASAADFRSIAEGGTVMYDAPSVKAKKLYVVSRDYPVEVVVNDGPWVKVRDVTGELAWVERKSLSERRLTVVSASIADVREAPNDRAAVAFRAQQGVTMELTDIGNAGWAKVKLRDGRAGYVRISQIWGL